MIINLLTQHISLRKRIYSGYIMTGVVALLLTLLSYMVFDRLAADFDRITLFSRSFTDNMAFVARMSDMQRQALIYIYEGHDAAGKEVGRIYQEMTANINRTGGLDPAADTVLKAAGKHLDNYYETFTEVLRQRELQKRLVLEEFRIHATTAQQLIEQLMGAVSQSNPAQTLEYSRMLNALLQIEKNAYRYFDTLNIVFVKTALANIRATQGMIKTMLTHSEQGDKQQLAQIAHRLDRYESSFLEAVQRTRGYLYLVNVVMAAETYETIYQTRKLSALMMNESEQIRKEVSARIHSTLVLLMSAAMLLLLFIILFSYLISRSITIPLDGLTRTFKSLSSGASDAEIPPYRQEDELGALTRAAESFRQRNIELEANRKELERSNEELEQFVYTVSHDLKSPIVTSMGFISIIRKLVRQGKYEQAFEKLDKVVKANERMSQLIKDLLGLSRVGRIDMDKKMIDLNELLNSFANQQAERLAADRFTLVVQPGMPWIYANESRTLQVFENILSNAVKYARNEAGGRLQISFADENDWLYIYCRDNGPGIPSAYHEKIFALFYRLDVDAEGTGVGLAVVKKIMKFHGGDIWVEPQSGQDGEGAVFCLAFPKVNK